MPILKLYTLENTQSCKLIKVNSFDELVEHATKKLGENFCRFFIKNDASEIDDEDVFNEIAQDHPKGLELVVLRPGEEYVPEANASYVINEVVKELEAQKLRSEAPGIESSFQEMLMKKWLSKKSKIMGEMSGLPKMGAVEEMAKGPFIFGAGTPALTDANNNSEKSLEKEKAEQEKLKLKIKMMEESKKLLNKEVETTTALKKKYEEMKKEAIKSKEKSETVINDLELKIAKLELSRQRIANLFEEFKEAEKVDICFLLDCTGSMRQYLEEAKTVIHRVTTKLSKRFKNLKLRVAFVGYRDHSDGTDRVTVLKFSSHADDFQQFVSKVAAKGGADACEDVLGGLEEVVKLEWVNMSRVLLHIGDAPCHGTRFHTEYDGDSYPDGDPRGLEIKNLLKKLVDLKVAYYFAEINESTVKMIEEFNDEMSLLGGKLIKVVNLKASEGLLDTVSQSISSTIHESKSRSLTATHGKLQKSVKLGKITWSIPVLKRTKVKLYKPDYDFSLSDIETSKIRYTCIDAEIYVAQQPFAEGALKFATAAYVIDPRARIVNKKCVMKESKFNDPKYNTRKYMEESIECQVISIFLANEFRRVSPSRKLLRFVDISYIKDEETGTYYSLEEYLDGEFFKMSNNAGYINEDEYSATMDAFTHWTHQATREYLVVTDLQGIRTKSTYLLTDPAITCPDDPDRFSGTNLGIKGLDAIFKSHQCNHICERLRLSRQVSQVCEEYRKPTSAMTFFK